MSESTKRCHSPPTGATPGKKPPKRHMQENVKKTSRKSLFQTGTVIKKKVESVVSVNFPVCGIVSPHDMSSRLNTILKYRNIVVHLVIFCMLYDNNSHELF